MRFIILFSLFIVSQSIFSQNLVLNPSFEITNTNCSQFGGEGFRQDLDPSWDNANSNIPGDSCSSPDLFSTCNISLGAMGGFTSVPNSTLGYKYSRTGTRHVGLIAYDPGTDYREYIQGQTSTPLIAGQRYCVSMYISLARASLFATNNIGINFYPSRFLRNACPGNSLIDVVPSLNYDCAPITDTTGWTRLQWDYVATGGEQFFVIGNFYNNSNSNTVPQSGNTGGGMSVPMPMAYYLIDDVSIVPNSCCYVDFVPTNVFCVSDPNAILTVIPPLSGSCTPANITGTWAGPGIVDAATGLFSPSQAGVGNHTITYTLSCGYVASRQIVVSPCQPLSVCQGGGNLTVSNGVAPYNWQNQVTTQDCSACMPGVPPFLPACSMPAGCAVNVTSWQNFASGVNLPTPSSFPIRVIDAAGTELVINNASSLPTCQACPTIDVTSVSVTNVVCHGGNTGSATVSATGGAGSYSYSWVPGNLSGDIQNGLAAGTYTVTATDADNCTGTLTITISQPTALTVQTSASPADCGVANGSAMAVPAGGTGPYTYAWSPSGGMVDTAVNLAAGTYTVTVTDANTCTVSGTVNVNNTNGPVITVVNRQDASCSGASDGMIEISVTGGNAPYQYLWTPTGGMGAIASNLPAGTYTVTVADVDTCLATETVTISGAGSLSLTMSMQPAGCGQASGSASVSVSGGTAPYTYAWSPSGGTDSTANNLSAGTYFVTVTDAGGCTANGNIEVLGSSSLTLTMNMQPAGCGQANGSASVVVTGGSGSYTYSWSPSGGNGNVASGLTGGTYTVTVMDNGGCSSSGTVIVPDADGPVITLSGIQHVNCANGNDGVLQIAISGGASPYTTYLNGNLVGSSALNQLPAGDHEIIIRDNNGCSSNRVSATIVQPAPLFSDSSYYQIRLGDYVHLYPQATTDSTNLTFAWFPHHNISCTDCLSPLVWPTRTTLYRLNVYNGSGCWEESVVLVDVYHDGPFIPNAFTPGVDNINDVWHISDYGVKTVDIRIFDRWGTQLFQTDNIYEGWDGKRPNGELYPIGVYVYKANIRYIDGELKDLIGRVAIVR